MLSTISITAPVRPCARWEENPFAVRSANRLRMHCVHHGSSFRVGSTINVASPSLILMQLVRRGHRDSLIIPQTEFLPTRTFAFASLESARRCAAMDVSSIAAANEIQLPLLENGTGHSDSVSCQWKCSISRIWTIPSPIILVKHVIRPEEIQPQSFGIGFCRNPRSNSPGKPRKR